MPKKNISNKHFPYKKGGFYKLGLSHFESFYNMDIPKNCGIL